MHGNTDGANGNRHGTRASAHQPTVGKMVQGKVVLTLSLFTGLAGKSVLLARSLLFGKGNLISYVTLGTNSYVSFLEAAIYLLAAADATRLAGRTVRT